MPFDLGQAEQRTYASKAAVATYNYPKKAKLFSKLSLDLKTVMVRAAMKNAQLWPLPGYKEPKPVFWTVAGFKMANDEVRKRLGHPHFTETDSTRTYGGDEDIWGFALESGQHVCVCFQIPYGNVLIHSDKPNLGEILEVLDLPAELVSDKSRFETYDPPLRA